MQSIFFMFFAMCKGVGPVPRKLAKPSYQVVLEKTLGTKGECLHGARPARYLSINYPDFSPRLGECLPCARPARYF